MDEPEPHAVYRFYSATDELLYIGCTKDPPGRFDSHRSDKPWYSEVVRTDMEWHPDYAAGRAAEREAIIAESPRYNLVRMRGNTTPRAFRLDTSLMAQVRAKATAQGDTITDIVRTYLRRYVAGEPV